MDKMLYLAMNGAKHVEWQQATETHNLANVHTNGFKADLVSFRALPVVGDGAPTRVYQVDNTVGHDLSQGALQQTGNDFDFALTTAGFFAVQLPDGTEAYTRDGGFELDATGTMRTALQAAGIPCREVSKVFEGRPHILDRIKNGEYSYIVNTTEGRQAIEDSKVLRRGALQHKANYTTTLNAAFATCKANSANAFATVSSVQELHKRVNG